MLGSGAMGLFGLRWGLDSEGEGILLGYDRKRVWVVEQED